MGRILLRNRKWLLLPVEVKAREFASRLFLAGIAAEEGYGVIFGYQSRFMKYFINDHLKNKLPKGIYLDKSIASNKIDILQKIRNLGHIIASLDEEGFAFRKENLYFLNARLSTETIGLTSHIYAWGTEMSEAILNRFPVAADKLMVTGNPRFDLLRPEFLPFYANAVQRILQKYYDYILIPSNFAAAINASGDQFLLKQAEVYGHIRTKQDRDYLLELIDYTKNNYKKFKEAILTLSDLFQGINFIIRPHPADNHHCWEKLADIKKNIKIVYEGSITPWLLGAKAVVHHGCTTGVEAYLLGVPSISYLPYENNFFDSSISNRINLKIYKFSILKDCINKIVTDGHFSFYSGDTLSRSSSKRFIASLDGKYSAEKIVEALLKIDIPDDDLIWDDKKKFKAIIRKHLPPEVVKIYHKLMWRNNIKADKNTLKFSENHVKQKYPGSDLNEVKEIMNKFSNITGRFNSLKIKNLDDDLFLIYK